MLKKIVSKNTFVVSFIFVASCALGKEVMVVNNDQNYKGNSLQVSSLVEQVSDFYHKPPGLSACIPYSQDARDPQLERDIQYAKKIHISEVLQYKQFYVDMVLSIHSRKDPVFLRVVLQGGKCSSFMLENFKHYDRR
ncbi:MAG: hypothetical protein U1F46_02510 [Marinagarivorans sp.]